jgi:hypothetical protein
MNIKQIITILTDISELISCNVYDADAMQELEPDSKWPSYDYQLAAIDAAIKFLTKLDNFTKSIVYFNSNKEA